ncbi:MAG: hypothetical protein WCN92_08675, partial [Eubacteriales bacterium]
MKEFFNSLFGVRQTSTIIMLSDRLKALFKNENIGFKPFVSMVLIISQILGIMVFDWGMKPSGQKLDMSKFNLVWSDEFNGTEVDKSIWGGHYVYGDNAEVRCGAFWHNSMADVSNGNLIIKTEYLDVGRGGKGPGYYTYGMDTRGRYEQCYGYFEVSCKFPA